MNTQDTFFYLKDLSNEELIQQTHQAIKAERESTTTVLYHLAEIDRRRLYLDRGFGSLFDYTTQRLGYSEDAAYRRIQAMRLLKSHPEAETQIENGTLSLSNAASLQRFFWEQEKNNEALPSQAKQELIDFATSKSTREVKRELARRNPSVLLREAIRAINDLEYELRMVIDHPLKEKIDRLKQLLSHQNPRMPYHVLLSELADLGLKKWDPALRTPSTKAKPDSAPKKELALDSSSPPPLRPHIPTSVRHQVWARDQHSCSYTDPQTQKRCGSHHKLQIDHIQPVALGGSNDLQNLRLLCAAHNQGRAAKTFH